MTSGERREFGSRVAKLRRQREMTQEELASAVGRTASWLSQVERGVQPVNRLDVLRLLADGLGVSQQSLRPDAPVEPGATAHGAVRASNDLDGARLLISGHPLPDVLLGGQESSSADLAGLRLSVAKVWDLTHSDHFAELSIALGGLVPRLEQAVRTAPQGERPELWLLLSRTYQAVAAAFVRQDDPGAAWVAADRAIRAAEQSGQALHVFASVFRLTQVFVRLRHLDQAEHAAAAAVAAIGQHTRGADTDPAALSVLGSLHLALALVHARAGNRTQAQQETTQARLVAQRLGEDRNDFDLECGPTNVEIQAVSISVDLGDAGEAIDRGERIDASGLSIERQARLLMDLGRAFVQRRQPGEALDCLLRAEQLAPEVVHTQSAARGAIRELVLLAGRSVSPELRALAERADAKP